MNVSYTFEIKFDLAFAFLYIFFIYRISGRTSNSWRKDVTPGSHGVMNHFSHQLYPCNQNYDNYMIILSDWWHFPSLFFFPSTRYGSRIPLPVTMRLYCWKVLQTSLQEVSAMVRFSFTYDNLMITLEEIYTLASDWWHVWMTLCLIVVYSLLKQWKIKVKLMPPF